MSGVRIFLCFDVDHDADLADLLCDQARRGGSGFEVLARSESGALSERWCESARRRITEADQVIVICGEHTGESVQVDAELRIAQEQGKPFFLLWGRREQMCTMPARVSRAGSMYSWTPEILLQQITATFRNAQPLEIPERYKRP